MQLFVAVWFALFIYIIGKGIGEFIENENSPVLTVHATVVDMRRKTHHHHAGGHHHHTHSYHVTFQTREGELLELRVKRYVYRELAVGVQGMLTHQGTRFQGFEYYTNS